MGGLCNLKGRWQVDEISAEMVLGRILKDKRKVAREMGGWNLKILWGEINESYPK